MPIRFFRGFLATSIVSAAALFVLSPAHAQVSFAPPVNYPAGQTINGLAVGDLNNDRHPDIIAVNNYSSNITVLLNNGVGAFSSAGNVAVGTKPVAAAIGDLDGDGLPDVVVANQGSNNISVLKGLGNGSLLPLASYATGTGPSAVALADLNRDGKLDVVVTNQSSNNVTVFLNQGLGILSPAGTYAVGAYPSGLAIVDLDNTGAPDIVTADMNGHDVSILVNAGNGTFNTRNAVNFPSNYGPSAVAAGDFNSDGKPDVAVLDYLRNTVTPLFSVGGGNLSPGTAYPTGGTYAIGMASGDFNADHHPDVVLVSVGTRNASVLVGNGDGSFQAPVIIGAGVSHSAVATGDLKGAGEADVVLSNSDNTVGVLLNTTTSVAGVTMNVPGTPYTAEQTHFAIGTITLSQPAGIGGSVVSVASSNQNVAYIPPSVLVVPQGERTTSFMVGGIAPGSVNISVTLNGMTTTVPFQVTPTVPGGGGGSALKGDMDGDNKLTINDVQLLMKIVGGMGLAG